MSQIRADNITNRQGTGAPIFVNGIRVTGLTSISNMVANTGTFSGAVSIGGTLTYEDVTNIDAVGLITARSGIKVTTGGIEVAAGGIQVAVGAIAAGAGVNVTSGNVHVGQGGSGANNAELKLQAGAATGNDVVAFLNQAGTTRGNITYDTDHNFLMINVNQGEKLRVSSDGKLGINETNPQTKLHLNGNYSENIVAVSGTAVDCSTGNYFTKTITGATTFTFTNVPSNVAYAFTFEVTLNGSNAITWPSSVKWPADTAPTITDGKTQVFVFLTDDGGTRWRGSSLVDYTN